MRQTYCLFASLTLLFSGSATFSDDKPAPTLGGIERKSLTIVNDAPLVQMLLPGFRVRELPVILSNINNVVYTSDGRLFAAGYDGRLHLLQDTDGDGLEDSVKTF